MRNISNLNVEIVVVWHFLTVKSTFPQEKERKKYRRKVRTETKQKEIRDKQRPYVTKNKKLNRKKDKYKGQKRRAYR